MKITRLLAGIALPLCASSVFAVNVELTIEFDDYPNETAFGLWNAGTAPGTAAYVNDPGLALDGIAYDLVASSPIGFGDGFVLPGDFEDAAPNELFTFLWDVGIGDYTFIILDAFGDGICCEFGAGSYSLSVNGETITTGGEFTEFEVTQFMVNDVPEPSSFALLAIGLIGYGVARWRK